MRHQEGVRARQPVTLRIHEPGFLGAHREENQRAARAQAGLREGAGNLQHRRGAAHVVEPAAEPAVVMRGGHDPLVRVLAALQHAKDVSRLPVADVHAAFQRDLDRGLRELLAQRTSRGEADRDRRQLLVRPQAVLAQRIHAIAGGRVVVEQDRRGAVLRGLGDLQGRPVALFAAHQHRLAAHISRARVIRFVAVARVDQRGPQPRAAGLVAVRKRHAVTPPADRTRGMQHDRRRAARHRCASRGTV